MADLTYNSGREFRGQTRVADFEVGPAQEVFQGMALMTGANGVIPAAPSASEKFVGFADEYVDNTSGSVLGGGNRAGRVRVIVEGYVLLTVANGSNWAATDVGVQVYASDSDTFTTAAGSNNQPIGKVVEVPGAAIGNASGLILVKIVNEGAI